MPKDLSAIVAQYETGKYQGREIDVTIEIHHNEDDSEDGNCPDWRVDNSIRLSGDEARKVLDFIKTLRM